MGRVHFRRKLDSIQAIGQHWGPRVSCLIPERPAFPSSLLNRIYGFYLNESLYVCILHFESLFLFLTPLKNRKGVSFRVEYPFVQW